MKKKKSDRVPDFTRPTMWLAWGKGWGRYSCRLRIIYPDGRAEWFCGISGVSLGTPCWNMGPEYYGVFLSAQETHYRMRNYSRIHSMKCILAGNI